MAQRIYSDRAILSVLKENGRDASFNTIPTQYASFGDEWSFDISNYINDGIPRGWIISLTKEEQLIENNGDLVYYYATANAISFQLDGTTLSRTIPTPPYASNIRPVLPDDDALYSITIRLTHPMNSSIRVHAFLEIIVAPAIVNRIPKWKILPEHHGYTGSEFSINLNNFVEGRPDPTITLESGTLGSYDLINGIFSGTRPSSAGSESFRFQAINSEVNLPVRSTILVMRHIAN